MQLGMVGLGRMGANMTRRLMRGGHTMVVSDLSADAVKGIAGYFSRYGTGIFCYKVIVCCHEVIPVFKILLGLEREINLIANICIRKYICIGCSLV